jgi:hypothetical protein
MMLPVYPPVLKETKQTIGARRADEPQRSSIAAAMTG